jgi:hypothetical protein
MATFDDALQDPISTHSSTTYTRSAPEKDGRRQNLPRLRYENRQC